MKLFDILYESGCGCGPECKCGGKCGGKCGDAKCPCECHNHTGKGKDESALTEDCVFEEVWVDEEDNILTEAAARQFKLTNKKITRKYRCMAGPKKGRLVAKPSGCATRKDPAKVRHGRKIMRSKKGVIARKSKITKKKAMNKIVAKMNKRLMGKPA